MSRSFRWSPGRILLAIALLSGVTVTLAFAALRPEREVTTRSKEACAAYMEGMEAMKKIYMVDAHRAWLRATVLDSTCAMAWLRLARLSQQHGDLAEAGRFLARAESQLPRLTPRERLFIQLLRADMSRDEKKSDKIIAAMLERYPEDAEILFMAGNRSFHRLRYEEALSRFEKVLVVAPQMGEVYNMMGYALSALSRWPEAVQAFQKYTFLYPDEANPHDSLGELYLRTGRYEDALSEFEKALAVKPDFGWGHFHSAMVYDETGRYEHALTAIRTAVAIDPDSPDWLMWKRYEIFFELAAGHDARALEMAGDLRRSRPDQPASHFVLGRVYAALGDAGKAAAALDGMRNAIQAQARTHGGSDNPDLLDNFQVLELAGEVAMASGDWKAADTCFARAIMKTDGWWISRRVQLKRAECLFREGAMDSVLMLTGEGLSTNSRQPAFHFWRAEALQALGRTAEAEAHYRKALEGWKDAEPGHAKIEEANRRCREFVASWPSETRTAAGRS